MHPRPAPRSVVRTALLASTLVTAVLGATALPASAGVDQAVPGTQRTASLPPTELMGDGPAPIPLKNMAMVTYTDWGPRYIAGQQDSDLTVTYVDGQIVFADLGTQSWKKLPDRCTDLAPAVGVAATCKIPANLSSGFFVQVWPRLGNDVVDGSTLPSQVRLWVLADAGRDRVTAGAGDDFVNGAQDADKVRGGAGNDWLRTGKGDDEVWGDAGKDKIVCQDGSDTAHVDSGDKVYTCEKTSSD